MADDSKQNAIYPCPQNEVWIQQNWPVAICMYTLHQKKLKPRLFLWQLWFLSTDFHNFYCALAFCPSILCLNRRVQEAENWQEGSHG